MLTKKVWAKIDKDNLSNEWLSLYQHSEDTYYSSIYVWDHFLDKYTKAFLSKEVGVEEHSLKKLFTFLSAIHDNGKATPAFQSQGHFNSQIMNMIESVFEPISKGIKSSTLRHEISSQKQLMDFLQQKISISPFKALEISTCIGGHHGIFNEFTLDELRIGRFLNHYDNNSKQWLQARVELIEYFYDKSGFNSVSHEYLNGIPKSVQSILTGLVIMSDWIASNDNYFPLTTNGQDEFSDNSRYEKALSRISLPSPWEHKKDTHSNDELFTRRFNLPDSANMRPVQKLMVDVANNIDEPSLIILEAPMGVGKTEASLLAAEIIAKKHNHGGVMFAMPTMATTNSIFPRVKKWLENSTSGNENILLKHSKVHLNDDFNKIKWDNYSEICEHDNNDSRETLGSVSVHDWFQGKRSILSPFLVTTIDNFLFAALIQKHYVLKHLGVIGKVIIIDEVHASDPYMQTFLSRAIEWAGYFGITVILLSATLPTSQKKMLLDSYKRKNKGVSVLNDENTSKMSNREKRNLARMKAMNSKVDNVLNVNIEYPLITTTNTSGVEKSHHLNNGEKQNNVEHSVKLIKEQDASFINDLLKDKDGNIAIIVNTVKESQDIYEQLKNDYSFRDCEITLFHSRFIAKNRADKEKELLDKFGPNSNNRPKRSITVATQVIEQSLDLDFDFMISEIAPIDSILQRMGRLHRHNRGTRPHDYNAPTIAIFGYTENNDGKVSFNDGSGMIYGEFLLLRTYKVLKQLSKGIINIPSDIPILVNKAYIGKDEEDQENNARKKYLEYIDRKKMNAKPYLLESPYDSKESLLGTNHNTNSVKDDIMGRSMVRDSQNSIEVIVLKKKGNGELTFLEDDSFVLNTSTLPKNSTIKKMLGQTIVLPNSLTYHSQIESTIDYLEKTGHIPVWQQNKLLKNELILILDENLSFEFENYKIIYDLHIGSKTVKLENK